MNNTANSSSKNRHGCLTAWLMVVIVLNSVIAAWYLIFTEAIANQEPIDASPLNIRIIGIFAVLNVIFSFLVFNWKKVGFWGFVATSIVVTIINLNIGIGIGQSLGGLIGIAVLFGVLQIKKDGVSGWEQMH